MTFDNEISRFAGVDGHHEAALTTIREKLKNATEKCDSVGVKLYGDMLSEYEKFVSEMKWQSYLQQIEAKYHDQ